MNSKRIFFICTIIICILSLSSVYAEIENDSVDNINNTSFEKFSQDIKNTSLKTVYLDEDITINEPLNIHNQTINGNNHVIDGNHTTRIFRTSGEVTVQNIIFKNANFELGSAIYNTGYLTIKNCQFIDNVASKNGAAVYSKGGSLTIQNSKFTNNQGFSTNGGAVYTNTKNTLIKNCIFSNNRIQSANMGVRGGALYCAVDSKIIDCTFKYNSCNSTYLMNYAHSKTYKSNGGAIYFYGGNHQVIGCKFTSNFVDNHGGSIFALTNVGSLKIDKCEFTSNKALYEDGGAISFCGKKLTVTNSKFNKNFANEDGGAIDCYSTGNYALNININKCVFNSNIAYKGAGAVWCGVMTNFVIQNSQFSNNKATVAGCFYIEGKSATINKCSFKNNKAAKITSYTVYSKKGHVVKHCAGAIYAKSGNVKITHSNFNSNYASSGGAVFNQALSTSVSKCVFTGNVGFRSSGALLNKGIITISSSTFKNNRAGYGGAISNQGTMSLSYSTFEKNAAKHGGAIAHAGKSTITNNVFYANSASKAGGAIFSETTKLTARHNVFVANNAKTYKAVCSKKKISLENNWWGNTKGNVKKSPIKLKLTNVKVKSWLYFKVKSQPSKLAKGKKSTISIDLRHTNKNKKSIISLKLPASISAKQGSLNSKSVKISKGIAKVKFKKTASKTAKVKVKVLGVKVNIKIK